MDIEPDARYTGVLASGALNVRAAVKSTTLQHMGTGLTALYEDLIHSFLLYSTEAQGGEIEKCLKV